MIPPPPPPINIYFVCVCNNLPYLTDNVASISVFKTSAVLHFGTSLGEEVLAIGSELTVKTNTPETSRGRLLGVPHPSCLKPVKPQDMGPNSCHTMPSWLNERWVQIHEMILRWSEGKLSSACPVWCPFQMSRPLNDKRNWWKVPCLRFLFILCGGNFYHTKFSFFFLYSTEMDVTQRFREWLLHICRKVAVFYLFIFLKSRCCSNGSFKAPGTF